MELNTNQLNHRIQWVRDLASGEFAQGRGQLRNRIYAKPSYCCLGVANLQVDPEWESGAAFVMKDGQAESFGLDRDDQSEAAGWNDTDRLPFDRIADLVAYATVNLVPFKSVDKDNVREGFAGEWLALFGSVDG